MAVLNFILLCVIFNKRPKMMIRFVLVSGRNAFIGIGFADRGDSFDLIVSLQDHFKYVLAAFLNVHCLTLNS